MAVTTLTSNLGKWNRPSPRAVVPAEMWFGRRVPDDVTAITTIFDHLNDQLLVRWRIKGDPEIYEMPFTQTDEGVMAALAAMKLTC